MFILWHNCLIGLTLSNKGILYSIISLSMPDVSSYNQANTFSCKRSTTMISSNSSLLSALDNFISFGSLRVPKLNDITSFFYNYSLNFLFFIDYYFFSFYINSRNKSKLLEYTKILLFMGKIGSSTRVYIGVIITMAIFGIPYVDLEIASMAVVVA